jgi:hypothetical protein
LLTENFERAFEQAARLASFRGRVEQDNDSHGLATEECRIDGRKSRRRKRAGF